MNLKYFKEKKIVVTGHTGFKGSWLVSWLHLLGADIMGISLNPTTKPNHFDYIKKNIKIKDIRLDINNHIKVSQVIKKFKPDIVFHLAAQALVSKSYVEPRLTFQTNTLGVFNILNSVKSLKKKCSVIIVTSDKCYKNKEITRSYKEEDELGGDDFYSASKASSEILIRAFFLSFLKNNDIMRICTARAGNVVGGGDWSDDRLIPDCIKKWSKQKKVFIRNPHSTRPWQHVLEAISGYLYLAYNLEKKKNLNGSSFNFSNNDIKNITVRDFLTKFKKNWKNSRWQISNNKIFHENNLLQLNSTKSKKILKWKNKMTLNQTVELTSKWYLQFYKNKKILTFDQIEYFMKLK